MLQEDQRALPRIRHRCGSWGSSTSWPRHRLRVVWGCAACTATSGWNAGPILRFRRSGKCA